MPSICVKSSVAPRREYLTPIAGRKAHLPGVIFHLVVDQRCAWDVSAIYLPISAYGLAFQLIVTLAEELALNEASYIMVRLLQEFECGGLAGVYCVVLLFEEWCQSVIAIQGTNFEPTKS
jgi:hypothetical protein